MESSTSTNDTSEACRRQQALVAELGERALVTDDVEEFSDDVAAAVAETLAVDRCGVIESLPDGDEGYLVAGVGWPDDAVGSQRASMAPGTHFGETLRSAEPVVATDLTTPDGADERPSGTGFLARHDVASAASVRIGPPDDPWGVLGVYERESREFTDGDVAFLRSLANALASAIEIDHAHGNDRPSGDVEAMYDRISDAFFALDDEWRFTHLNEHARELIAPEGEDLVGREIWSAFPEAGERRFKAEYERAMREQETIAFEAYYPAPPDAWFEVRAYPSDEGLSVYFQDITERKERERELERYESIVETISDGVYALDDDENFVMVNDAFTEMTGYDRKELLGEPSTLVHSDDVNAAARRGVDSIGDGRAEGAVLDLDLQTSEGEWIAVESRFGPYRFDDGCTGRCGVVRDVSERKERERELERTERRFEAIFEDPNILVGLLEPDGTVLDINGTAMEYIDADLADVRGEPFWETPWWGEGDDVPPDVMEWTERAADGEYVDFETDLTRPDGSRYTLNGSFRPVTNDDGEVVSVIVSDRDVTERREYERQLEESEHRYRTLAEHFPNGIVTLFDGDLRYELAAGQAFANLPIDPGDVEGSHVSAVWGEDIADDLEPIFEATLDGEERSIELEYAGREWVIHAVPLTDERGRVFAGMTMAQDITERKEREQELAKYETIVETINDGIYVKDEDGYFTMVNEAYAELTGYDRAELVGEHASLVVDEEILTGSQDLHAESTAGRSTDGKPATGQSKNPTMEAEIQRADGDTVPTEGTFASIETDDERESIGVVRDITERKARRRRIEESERRYRTLIENFPSGAVGLFDEDMEYTAVGGELVEAAGVDVEDRIGNSVYDIYPDEVVAEVEPHFHAALEGEANSFEVDYHGRHLFAHTLPVEGDDGEIFAGMLVVQDVTERREAQQDLRESEARFRMLAENLQEIVWMAEPDGEEFIYVNPAFEEIWGIEREAIYDDSFAFLEAVHPADRERVRDGFEALPEEPFDDEYRVVRPDGEVRWVHSAGAQVHDEDAEMVRVVGTAQDITKRIEREHELERALDFLERTERIADVGGWEIDPETEDVFWSEHLFDLLDVEGDEEPSLDGALDMYHEEDESIVEEAVDDALESGDAFDVEVRLRTGGGQIRWLRLQGAPETVDGEVVSLRGAAQDVTDRKRRERRLEELVDELEESNERLEQFAYAASHDLQEPLRMVSSYLQLIEDRYVDALDEDGEEFLEFAVDGADRMRDMIDALLEYSRVDTRGDPFEPVDLDEAFGVVREDLQVAIEAHDARIEATSLPTVEADAEQVRQVFQNLVENAIEYSGEQAPRIRVSAADRGDEWAISVRDEGVGIDPDDTDRVFEVFESLHSGGENPGTGVGLALCERIVERHGGDIWVESEPGDGSTFTFTLPALDETNE